MAPDHFKNRLIALEATVSYRIPSPRVKKYFRNISWPLELNLTLLLSQRPIRMHLTSSQGLLPPLDHNSD